MSFRRWLLIACCCPAACFAQWPLINEVVPSKGDRVEIFLPVGRPVDLMGYHLVLKDRVLKIDTHLVVQPGGFAVIELPRNTTEAHSAASSLRLPRNGGTLLLIAPDGASVVDMFTWKDVQPGESHGRVPDGGPNVQRFAVPTPGTTNADRKDGPALLAFIGGTTVRLDVDSADLWSADRGIDTEGAHANFSRRGPDWIRDAVITNDGGKGTTARMRVAGSGSRSLPKRSFHLCANDASFVIANDTCAAITLRADASPDAFLRNGFINTIAGTIGGNVDVQPDVPVRIELNGRYHGLYRAMPKKNAQWVRAMNHDRPIDLLEGPRHTIISGDPDDFDAALTEMASGAPIGAIDTLFDLNSLIDLACLDLYTGRADHDLNVRCWRSRARGGRWRWILYDMDLWAPVEENSVERMLTGAMDEAPFVPALFAHPILRERLLIRITALLNTVLLPTRSGPMAESLFNGNSALMREDHERWKDTLAMPSPEASIAALLDHIDRRPAILLAQLARATDGRTASRRICVDPPGSGTLLMEGLAFTDSSASMTGLCGVRLCVEAKAAAGYEFAGWSVNGSTEPVITIDPADQDEVRALFRPLAWSRRHGLQQAGE